MVEYFKINCLKFKLKHHSRNSLSRFKKNSNYDNLSTIFNFNDYTIRQGTVGLLDIPSAINVNDDVFLYDLIEGK